MNFKEIAENIMNTRLNVQIEGLEYKEIENDGKELIAIKIPSEKLQIIKDEKLQQVILGNDIHIMLTKEYDFTKDVREIGIFDNNTGINVNIDQGYGLLYTAGDSIVLEIVDIKQDVVSMINGIEPSYPKIIVNIKVDAGEYLVSLYLRYSLQDSDILLSKFYQHSFNEATDMANKYYERFNNNIQSIIKIAASSEDNKVVYCTEAGISIVTGMNDYCVFCKIIDVKDTKKVEVLERGLDLYKLLEYTHTILPLPKYIYYNGMLFSDELKIVTKRLTSHYPLQQMMDNVNDALEIIRTGKKEDYVILENLIVIIDKLIKDFKTKSDFKYFQNMIIHYFGKIFYTKSLLSNIEQHYNEIVKESAKLKPELEGKQSEECICPICKKQVSELTEIGLDGDDDFYKFDVCQECADKYTGDTYRAEDILRDMYKK